MEARTGSARWKAALVRAVVEIGFIIFLFYSNLLMGEFNRTNQHGKTLLMAVENILTVKNFVIANLSAFLGFAVVEYLRKRA